MNVFPELNTIYPNVSGFIKLAKGSKNPEPSNILIKEGDVHISGDFCPELNTL